MKSLLKLAVLLWLLLMGAAARAQVGVGTATPDAKAALDIRASDKGLLIPRLTAAQRTGIAVPPQGLMVYQTDGTASGGTQTGFWYYAGTGGWVYLDAAAGGTGLTLPYSGTASTIGSVFQITNSGAGIGVRGASASGQGVVGRVNGTGAGQGVVGVKGTTIPNIEDAGVVGLSDADYAVYARSSQNTGIVGISDGPAANLAGVQGSSTAPNGVGISGYAPGTGVLGTGSTGAGVDGTSNANTNTTGGVVGRNTSGSSAVGVLGLTTTGYGVRGVASASGGFGVQGLATDSYALIGTSASGVGAQGTSTSSYGVRGNSNSSNGVYGTSSSNSGVYGTTAAGNTGGVAGVEGTSTNSSGIGVLGTTTSGYGVRGEATGSSGFGVSGVASGTNGYGLIGTGSGAASGVYGTASGTGRAGYFNHTSASGTANALEVQNASLGRTAFFSQNNASSTTDAVSIFNAGSGATLTLSGSGGVAGVFNDVGSISFSRDAEQYAEIHSFAAPFVGPSLTFSTLNNASQLTTRLALSVLGTTLYGSSQVQGNLNVTGALSKGGGSFKIDHPLDPENQYLYHSFVESPDMLNVYNGNVTLDARGEATVQLPDYFETLNRDFRYQLTPIGAAFTPYVQEKVAGNRFRIAGQPGAEVSWQVTGIRHDNWANQNRIPTAQAKEPENRGKYLHPEAFGQPAARGIGHEAPRPAAATPSASQHSTFTSTSTTAGHEE